MSSVSTEWRVASRCAANPFDSGVKRASVGSADTAEPTDIGQLEPVDYGSGVVLVVDGGVV